MKNISLKGMLCSSDPLLKKGETCNAIIWLANDLKIEVQGRIVRTSPDLTAIDFTKMNVESFSHLYNLVRLHSNDPDKLDRELSYPAF